MSGSLGARPGRGLAIKEDHTIASINVCFAFMRTISPIFDKTSHQKQNVFTDSPKPLLENSRLNVSSFLAHMKARAAKGRRWPRSEWQTKHRTGAIPEVRFRAYQILRQTICKWPTILFGISENEFASPIWELNLAIANRIGVNLTKYTTQ